MRSRFVHILQKAGAMLAYVLASLAAWFAASAIFGIVLGKLIAAHERSSRLAPDTRERSTRQAA